MVFGEVKVSEEAILIAGGYPDRGFSGGALSQWSRRGRIRTTLRAGPGRSRMASLLLAAISLRAVDKSDGLETRSYVFPSEALRRLTDVRNSLRLAC
jgi:hypothetical protein